MRYRVECSAAPSPATEPPGVSLTGRITGGDHGRPFAAAARDIGRFGYVEEEYFLDGTATPYLAMPGAVLGRDGHWRVRADEPEPFRTRLLVRRPVDPARFNGCVVVC